MRISLEEMSDQELLKNHFESGLEMMRRNMVGAEIWKTGEGVITNGSKEAREAILNIYQDPQSGFQQVLEECSLTAAKTQDQSPQNILFEYSVIRGLLTLAFDSSDAVFFTMPLYLTATYLHCTLFSL